MKKLILFLGIFLPAFVFAQTSFTPQFKRKVPTDSLLGYSIPGITGTNWIPDTAWLSHHNVAYFNRQHSGSGTVSDPIGIKNDTLTDVNNVVLVNDSGNFHNTVNKMYWYKPAARFEVVQPIFLATTVYFGYAPAYTPGDSALYKHNGQLVAGPASGGGSGGALSPDAIIFPLAPILVNDTTVEITPGTWRINNNIHSISSPVDFTLAASDTVKSRYEIFYADSLGQVDTLSSALAINPIIPQLPTSTVLIGTVFIQPSGAKLVYGNAKTLYTENGHILSPRTVFGNGNPLVFSMDHGFGGGGTHVLLDSVAGFEIRAAPVSNLYGSELHADTNTMNFIYGSPNMNLYGVIANTDESMFLGKIDSVGVYSVFNWGMRDTLGNHNIEVELDKPTAVFHYRNNNNDAAIRAQPSAIPTMAIVRAIADSVGTAGVNIGNSDLTLTGNRTLTGLGNGFIVNLSASNDSLQFGGNSSLFFSQYQNKTTGQNSGFTNNATIAQLYAGSGSTESGDFTVQNVSSHYQLRFRINNGSKKTSIETAANTGVLKISDQIANKGLHADSLSIYPLKLTSPWDYLPRKVTDSLYAHAGSAFTLTVTGSSGAATYTSGVLNIPTYTLSGLGGLANSNFVTAETPSGSINSSNTAFTLANTPVTGTVKLYRNGTRQIVGTDYTISGTAITELHAPLTGDSLIADYTK